MIGIDTTFIVQAEVMESAAHLAARRFLRDVAESGKRLALASQVLTEFVHVVTDPKRFSSPLKVEEAVTQAQVWWSAKEVHRVHPTAESVDLFLRWMREKNLGRKRLLDTHLAATYRAAGVARVLTSNERDFRSFGFEIVDVTAGG